MAKKNGEFGIDDDFNFDDFNFDDSIPGMKSAKDNRHPISEVAGSFLGSVKETVTSEPFVRRMVTESLPEGYGKAINTSYEALGTLRELYDSGVREFKPADTALRNIASKLTPSAKKILPKKLADKLESYSKGGTSGFTTPSKAEMDERSINESLADIFRTQAAADYQKGAYDEAKEQIRDSIEDKKFNLGFKEQQTVRQGIQRLVAYQDQVTAHYQKKNLELQYRQFFALRDISEVVRHESRISNEFLKAIAHNSALPDIVKSKFREVGKALFEERLAAGATNMVNRYVSQFMPNLRKRVLMTGRNLVSGFARGITEANSAVDMASSMGMSGSEVGGSVAGGFAADELGYQGSKWVRGKVGNMDRVKRFGHFLDNRFSGIPEKANEWARTQSTRGGLLGWLENLAKATVGTYSPDYTASRSPLTALDQATAFNNQTQRSITEIIPGYLARIFREISWLRTGADPGMTLYNYDRGSFTSDKQVQSDIKTRILHPTNVGAFQYSAGRMMDAHDPMRSLSKKQRELYQHQLLMDAETGLPYDPSRYLRPGFRISGASAMDSEAIVRQIRKHFNVAEGSNKINLKDNDAAERLHQGRQMWEEARRRYPSPTDMIRVYAETGHLDQLHNMGFVVRNGLENRVNPEEIYRSVTGDMNDYTNPPPRDYPPGASGAGGPQVPPMGPKGPEPPRTYAKRRPKPNEPSGGGAATVEEAKKTVYERMQRPRKGKKGKRYSVSSSLAEYPVDAQGNLIDPHTGEPVQDQEQAQPEDKIEALFRKQQERINRIKEDISRMSARTSGPTAEHVSHIPPGQRNAGPEMGAEAFETMADRIARAVEMSGQRVIDTLESGKLVQESLEQTQTQQSIEKMVRAMLRRMLGDRKLGAHDDGDAHFSDEDEDLPLGDSPEARLVRALMKVRRKAGAGVRWARGKVTSGFGALRSKGKAWLASGNTVFGKAWQWGKDTLQDLHDRTIDMATDLYVKGMNSPILEKAKLMAGEYYDEAGKVIRRWSDIKGSVYDKMGNVVVDAKDISRGFYDKHGKRILNSVTSRVGAAFWKLASLWSPTRWINSVRDAGHRAVNWMRDLVDQAMDIYVRGESTPRMKAVVMAAGGYFSDRTGAPVKKPSQIDGIVRDDKGNIVIDLEDIKKGLVNVFGIPVGNLSTVVKRIVSGAFRRVKDAVTKTAKWAIDKGVALGKGAWNVAKNTFHGVTGFLKHGVGFFGAHPELVKKQTDILQKIYDLLDDRLPNRRLRLGSYEQELKGEHAFEGNDDNKKKKPGGENAKNPFSKFFDWLKGKFGNKGKGGGINVDINGLGGAAGEAEEAAKDAEKAAAKSGMFSKLGGWIEKKVPGGKWINKAGGLVGKGVKGIGKGLWKTLEFLDPTGGLLTGLLAKGGKLGGKVLGGLKNLGGKGLNALRNSGLGGKLGRGWQGIKGFGRNLLGKLKGARGMGQAGTELAEMGEGAGALGTEAAGAAGAEAAGTGLTTALADATFAGEGLAGAGAAEGILGGLAALVSAPVLIGAAAIALVGYGAYKLYRHYHDKLGTLETVRMAQYGVDDKSPDKSNKIRDLEALLAPHVKYGGKVPTIDAKAVQLDQMLDIFGITQTQRDKVLRWGTWFVKRFKPVFLTHMEVLHKLDSKVSLANVDKDLPKKLKMRYLDSIGVPEDIYKVSASPFSESHFLFWSKADPIYNTSAFVDEAFKKARKELQKDGLKNETTKERAAIGMVLAGSKGYDKASQFKPGDAGSHLDMEAFHLKPEVAGGIGKAGGVLTTVSTISIMNKSRDVSGLTALQAVRMKAYGLVKMDMDKVHLLLDLEDQVISRSLEIQGSGHIAFKDKPELYQKLYAARFGVDNSDKTSVSDWLQWFVARFLPTLIQYVTSIKAANKSAMLQSPEMMLKPEQMLKVATAVVGAQSSVSGSLVSVWKIQNAPWPGYVTNDDSSTTKVNIDALKEMVHEMELRQQQVKKINENRGAPGKSGKGPEVDRTSRTYGSKPNAAVSKYPTQAVGAGAARGYQATAMQGAGYASSVHGANMGSSNYTPGTAAQIGAGLGGKAATLPVPNGNGWNNIKDMILGVSQMTGVDAQTLATFTFIESGDKISAKAGTSSASGLFQFTGGTWRQMLATYGKQFGIPANTPSTDPRASAIMGAMYIKENAAILKRATGREPSVAELYMAHFLGPGGAVKILTAPSDTPISSAVSAAAYRANRSLFARAGDTVGQFENYINDLVTKKSGWNTGGGTNARTINQAGKAGHQFGGHTTNAAVHNGADVVGTIEGSREKGFTTKSSDVPGYKPSSSVPMPSIQASVAPVGSTPHAPTFKPATTPIPTSTATPATPAPQLTSPTPMAPVRAMDDDRIESIAHHQQAIQTVNEVMSRRANDRISDSTEKMTDLLSQQLDVQKSMDSSLKSIKDGVGILQKLSAQQLGAMAKANAPKGDDAGKQVVSNGQVKTAKPMPKLPVDVSRKSSSRLAG